MRYLLTPAAQDDLENIWLYTYQNWSLKQANNYNKIFEQAFLQLCDMPEIARERLEFNPPVRVFTVGSHLVLYRVQDDNIIIIRILGGKQDWVSMMNEIDT